MLHVAADRHGGRHGVSHGRAMHGASTECTNGRDAGTLDAPIATARRRAPLRGARLVVLGGTGFLGKVFWSMLLDRYPGVGRIYLLVRPKDGGRRRRSASGATSRRARRSGRCGAARRRLRGVPPREDRPHRRRHGQPALRPRRGARPRAARDDRRRGQRRRRRRLQPAARRGARRQRVRRAEPRRARARPRRRARSCTRAPATSRARARGPSTRTTRASIPFPRADELGAELWDPDREIAECLDLIAQAKHRCDDAFRQSEFAEEARKNLASRGEPRTGAAYERELARVKRKFVSDRLIEAGLDRATHWGWPNIYTYTKSIGEQVIARSGLPLHHRAARVLRVDARVPVRRRGTRASTRARRSSTSS